MRGIDITPLLPICPKLPNKALIDFNYRPQCLDLAHGTLKVIPFCRHEVSHHNTHRPRSSSLTVHQYMAPFQESRLNEEIRRWDASKQIGRRLVLQCDLQIRKDPGESRWGPGGVDDMRDALIYKFLFIERRVNGTQEEALTNFHGDVVADTVKLEAEAGTERFFHGCGWLMMEGEEKEEVF